MLKNSISWSSLGHSLSAVVKQLTGKNQLQRDDEKSSAGNTYFVLKTKFNRIT